MDYILKNKVFFLVLAGIYGLAYAIQSQGILNWDVCWLVEVATRLAQGGTYVNDFFEINPPLILYLYLPVVGMTKWFGISHAFALQIYVFLLASISLAFTALLAKRIFAPKDKDLLQLFLLAVALIFLVLPFMEFGQREHLLVILTLPYLLLMCLRIQNHKVSTKLAVWIGLLAALGFGIKPYFLLTPVLIEGFYLWHSRNLKNCLRPETLTMLVLFVIYVTSVWIWQRDYFRVILPFARHFYYSPYQRGLKLIFTKRPVTFCMLPLLLGIMQYKHNPYKALSMILMLAFTGYFGVYLWQHENWYYHLIPAYLCAILLLTLELGIFSKAAPQKKITYAKLIFLIVLTSLFLEFSNPDIDTMLVFYPQQFIVCFSVLFAILLGLQHQALNAKKIIFGVGCIIGLGSLFSYFNRGTDWNTHRFLLTLTIFIMVFYLFTPRETSRRMHALLGAILTVILFCFPFYYAGHLYQVVLQNRYYVMPIVNFLNQNARQTPVYFFANSSVNILPSIEMSGAIPVFRTQDTGWVPGMLHDVPGFHQTEGRNFIISMISADLNKYKPKYVFVGLKSLASLYGSTEFSYLEFFANNNDFRAAWRPYHYLSTISADPFFKYAIYQRDNT